jgi:hypothetical protein
VAPQERDLVGDDRLVPKVAIRPGSTPGRERAYAIAARQSSSCSAESTWSGSPVLSPKPR